MVSANAYVGAVATANAKIGVNDERLEKDSTNTTRKGLFGLDPHAQAERVTAYLGATDKIPH